MRVRMEAVMVYPSCYSYILLDSMRKAHNISVSVTGCLSQIGIRYLSQIRIRYLSQMGIRYLPQIGIRYLSQIGIRYLSQMGIRYLS